MENVTVDLDSPSLYAESNTRMHRLKRKFTYSNVLRLIHKNLQNKDKFHLLEIGTGSGFLISFLENKYPNATFDGIEYDPRLVELGNTKLTRSSIIQGNAEQFQFECKFDMIVSLQVIEHLYNPEKMVDSVKKCLNVNGVFIFTTPNLGCLSETIMKNKWHGYREDHVALKNCKEWDDFMIQNGFSKVYSGSTFFTGIPFLNKFPFGIFNWSLLYLFGSFSWKIGESYIGVFNLKK
jgi:SAM-dependent methyltransferase